MSKEDKISKLVKDSFENENAGSAPDLWNDISSDLSGGNGLDDYVRQSFESNTTGAPANSWERLQNQMDINLVWKRISEDLDRKPLFAWWRLAALFLLLISSAAAIPFIYSDNGTLFNLKEPIGLNYNHYGDSYFNIKQEGIGDNFDFVTKSQYLNLLSDIFGESQTEPLTQELPEFDYVTQSESITNSPLEEFNSPIKTSENYNLKSPSSISLIAASHNPQFVKSNMIKIENEPNKKHNFSIGLIAGIQNTWIIDENLKQSFSSESLTSTSPAFGEKFGLNVDYEFNKESGIISEFFYSSRMRQKINYYEQGFYVSEKTDINYYKLSLLYYKEKWIQGSRFYHQLKLGFGGYAGLRKNNLTVQNNELIITLNTGYERFDYGLRMIAGEEYEGKKWILGYGFQSEIGLNNIESNSNNVATNLNIGIYTTLRYKL